VGILVKPDDTVVPGQLIATVDETTAEAGLFAAPPPRPAAAAGGGGGETGGGAAAAAAAAAAHTAAAARVPGIHFPLRVTPDGQRISALPAAEAARWLQQAGGGGGGAAAAAAAAAAPVAAAGHHVVHSQAPIPASAEAVGKTGRAKVRGGGRRERPPLPRQCRSRTTRSQPSAPPARAARHSPRPRACSPRPCPQVVTMRLKEQPPRIRMTDRELEAIMLGGALD
jgi:pyruvate/2-oxoglutarate dehydrogenase complex dihydrolipoamide acyltransferase (E2) component